MPNLLNLVRNVWIRIILIVSAFFVSYILIVSGINAFVITPLTEDIKNAKKGISRHEGELQRMEQELKVIEKKMKEREISGDKVRHYYTMYMNPVQYINRHFLSQAKPSSLIITGSSVSPNTGFTSSERTKLKPFLKEYGISKIRNLNKTFSVVRINLSATGSFSAIGEYLSNLYSLPVKFSVRSFDLVLQNNSLKLSLDLAVVVYRIDSN